ncbi:hypothetical protein G5T41_02595 [Acinetobacter sp. GFQ9D192M]|uniref:hypothetical protein n=1 Tax=unclassified Acinetobacter TaxID=196816 RepID=UPI0014095047|nr:MULTISPECIES: hypothetical protein [unclassified Acinetobacter]NHB65157.1 hypothetical protein [Acinetobacter sp. GFQ9D191M]NHB99433.1 hypothetical protein [Acinetobacter sp. GFQ9D192M]
MSRKLLIFGNGLGMAIDANHYSLTNALNTVWHDDSLWNDTVHRELIQNCIPTGQAPQTEEELDKLYLVSTSCDYLNDYPNTANGEHWLSNYGQEFTQATQEYIHTVASHLFASTHALPTAFKTALINFVRNTKSHVATLNYDKLIYQEFIQAGICNGFYGQLVDGFTDGNGFNSSNLVRMYDNNFGYYMHLHGCPLFEDVGNVTRKRRIPQISSINSFPSKHIVLTHIPHKPSVIAASNVLAIYWRYLVLSIHEAEEIILFGYSGLDTHLNELLKLHASTKAKKVIEWDGGGQTDQQRQQFWDGELGSNVNLQRMPDITQFTAW